MTVTVSEDTLRTAAAYREALASGADPQTAVHRIAAAFSLRRDVVRSRLRRQGLYGRPEFEKGMGRHCAGLKDADWAADRIIPPTEPVHRDPCQRCGVRADIGCGCSKARLGMVL
jgi:hypothetical protein